MACALALSVATASRADEPFELSWRAPPNCPQQSAVREQIDSLVPRAMLERGRLRAQGTITRVDGRFRLRLVMQLGATSGERSIESDSCADLAGAAAVALGLLLQSGNIKDATDTPATDASPTNTAVPETPSVTSDVATDRTASPGSASNAPALRDEPRVDDGIGDAHVPPEQTRSVSAYVIAPQASFEIGPLPRPSIGVAATVGARLHAWEVMVEARLPTKQRVELAYGLGAELDHYSISLATCRALGTPPLELSPCAAIGLERLSARGRGPLESPRVANATWLSVGAEAWGRWYATSWFLLALGVGGRLQAARPSVEVDGISQNERMRPIALSVKAGPMLVF